MDKKNFFVNNHEFKLVITKRSYLEWYTVTNGTKIRHVKFGGISRKKTDADKLVLAMQLATEIAAVQPKKTMLQHSHIQKILNEKKFILSDKTITGYTSMLKKYSEYLDLIGKNELTITTDEAKEFLYRMSRATTSNTTIKNYIVFLKSMYKALKCDVWNFDFKIKVQKQSKMFFSTSQSAAILKYCKNNNLVQLEIAIKLLFYCFVRPKEIRLLKVKHINFELQTITIPASISKNRKTQTVVIPSQFLPDLEPLQQLDENTYVVSLNAEIIAHNWLNNCHRQILSTLNINGNYSFYSWKHTGAVACIRNGINLKDLQLQLRHHSLDMVNEYLKNLGVLDSFNLREKYPTI